MAHLSAADMAAAQRDKIGALLGPSSWRVVTQAATSAFGESTDDQDPMHVDPEWAAAHSPFGGTIAFGFWTLAMLTSMVREISGTTLGDPEAPEHTGVNYGFNRVRFIEPVPVGSRIRARMTPLDVVAQGRDRLLVTMQVEIEVEGRQRPAVSAEWLSMTLLPTEGVNLDGFRAEA